MKKILSIILSITMLLSMGTVAFADGVDGPMQKAKIKVAISADFPPFESYNENGELYGFDIDLMNYIGDRIGFDIEALIHFMHKRLCTRADEPIRQVARLMRKEVLAVEPRYSEFLVPQCQALMYCPEKHGSCGAYPSKEELRKLIKE